MPSSSEIWAAALKAEVLARSPGQAEGEHFAIEMKNDDEAATIVRSTVSLGHSMGLKLVAEGIEDQEIMDSLKELVCGIRQGYHVARPAEAPQFEEWLKQRLR